MDTLIVDDEPLARNRLRRMLQQLGHEVVAEAQNKDEALEAVNDHDPAVVLLDIEMPGCSGLAVGQTISSFDNPPAIIFCTAYDHYALDAFDTLAVSYLLKPIRKDQLAAALAKAQKLTKAQLEIVPDSNESSQSSRKHITAKTYHGIELIELDSIRCFMADHKYVTVFHTNGSVLIDDTLKELELELSNRFVRVHRNALISIEHIQSVEHDTNGHYSVCLADVEERPAVSRRYISKLRKVVKSI